MTRPEIEPRYPGPLANTLTIMPITIDSKVNLTAAEQTLGLGIVQETEISPNETQKILHD